MKTACSKSLENSMAPVGQFVTQSWQKVHDPRSYIQLTSFFFFLPSGRSTILLSMEIVPLGQER